MALQFLLGSTVVCCLTTRAVYTVQNPMIGGTLDFRGISENWNETLRGGASIKAGIVAPSALMRPAVPKPYATRDCQQDQRVRQRAERGGKREPRQIDPAIADPVFRVSSSCLFMV